MTRRVLVLGGTGFVGRSLCAHLSAAGDVTITVPTRRRAAHKDLAMRPGLELVEADVHDDAALLGLLEGQDAVVNLVAILHGTPAAFHRVHVDLPRRLATLWRRSATPRRLLHVSALGVPDPGQPEAPSNYLRSKAQGEAALHLAVQEATGASPLDLTIFRPSLVFGAGDALFNLFARLQSVAPLMALGGAAAPMQPVWVEDLAAGLQRALWDPAAIDQTYEAVGPQVMSLGDIVRLAGETSGHPRPVIGLPEPLAAVQAALLGLLPGEPLMTVDNLRSLRVPNIATGRHPTLEALGLRPLSPQTVVPTYLDRSCPWLDRWRRQAGR